MPASTLNPPALIQVNRCSWMDRLSADLPSRDTNANSPSTKASATVATPSRCAQRLVTRSPSSSSTRAPNAGSAMITHSTENTPPAVTGCTTGTPEALVRYVTAWVSLVLQQAGVVD